MTLIRKTNEIRWSFLISIYNLLRRDLNLPKSDHYVTEIAVVYNEIASMLRLHIILYYSLFTFANINHFSNLRKMIRYLKPAAFFVGLHCTLTNSFTRTTHANFLPSCNHNSFSESTYTNVPHKPPQLHNNP